MAPQSAHAADSAKLAADAPKSLPDLAFVDKVGKEYSLKDFSDKLIAVHFWATWCVPCVKEFPDVDAAQKKYGDKGFRVIAISLDQNAMPKVLKFFTDHQVKNLTPYLDLYMQSFANIQGRGMPTTIFVNSAGKELARAEGPLEWDSPEVQKFIEDNLK
ncbi:MAG: TlpA family protein disulfide reductase [Alphaproteobacteria bacterium]|nr:TlpA family protein disulfide reductase [Alphaproteobacteria bacterium]